MIKCKETKLNSRNFLNFEKGEGFRVVSLFRKTESAKVGLYWCGNRIGILEGDEKVCNKDSGE